MTPSVAEGLRTIVKFYKNTKQDSPNEIITRTLGKFGVIDNKQDTFENPKPEEFWVVEITKELQTGSIKGCFMLKPLEKVDIEQVEKILPDMCEVVEHEATIIFKPKEKWANGHWILPLESKKGMKGKSVILQHLNEVV